MLWNKASEVIKDEPSLSMEKGSSCDTSAFRSWLSVFSQVILAAIH